MILEVLDAIQERKNEDSWNIVPTIPFDIFSIINLC